MKRVTLLHVGHLLILFKKCHKTFVCMHMSIGYLESLVVQVSDTKPVDEVFRALLLGIVFYIYLHLGE